MNTELNEIEEKIRELLFEKFGKAGISSKARFLKGADGWDMDSLDFAVFTVLIEDTFDLMFDIDEEFYTLDELVSVVYRERRNKE